MLSNCNDIPLEYDRTQILPQLYYCIDGVCEKKMTILKYVFSAIDE